MSKVYLISKLERFWDAKKTLDNAFKYLPENCSTLKTLRNQSNLIQQKIKSIAVSIKNSLELEGIKSLAKRIKVPIKDLEIHQPIIQVNSFSIDES